MPNWVENIVNITGDEDVIKQLVLDELDFNKYRPCTIDECDRNKEVKDKYGFKTPAWYIWNCENWGTKWNVNDVNCNVRYADPRQAHFAFLTAWSPPQEFLRYLTEIMPGLTIKHRYYEGGMDIIGKCCYENGVMNEIDVEDEVLFVRKWFYDQYMKVLRDDVDIDYIEEILSDDQEITQEQFEGFMETVKDESYDDDDLKKMIVQYFTQ